MENGYANHKLHEAQRIVSRVDRAWAWVNNINPCSLTAAAATSAVLAVIGLALFHIR